MREKIIYYYQSYPKAFWVLICASFIDVLGGSVLFPFLSLFVTRKFEVGMFQVGQLFAIYAIFSLFGNLAGGAVADRFGRRFMLIFALIASALTSLLMGIVGTFVYLYFVAALVGLMGSSGQPAQHAMVADLLPEEQRVEGYGILRIAFNLGAAFGPAVGGFLASKSFMLLFVADAISSCIMALIVFFLLYETKPVQEGAQLDEKIGDTIVGYKRAFLDKSYMLFLLFIILMQVVYLQINTSLPVFLQEIHGVSTQFYGYLISLNAFLVVLFQFSISRWTTKKPPMLIISGGVALIGVGMLMFGFVSSNLLFFLAIAIFTLGEMLSSPTGQAVVSHVSPVDMRGRYMALFGFSFVLPSAIGPIVAGLIMDYYDPYWVWYLSGIVIIVPVMGFLWLHMKKWGNKPLNRDD